VGTALLTTLVLLFLSRRWVRSSADWKRDAISLQLTHVAALLLLCWSEPHLPSSSLALCCALQAGAPWDAAYRSDHLLYAQDARILTGTEGLGRRELALRYSMLLQTLIFKEGLLGWGSARVDPACQIRNLRWYYV